MGHQLSVIGDRPLDELACGCIFSDTNITRLARGRSLKAISDSNVPQHILQKSRIWQVRCAPLPEYRSNQFLFTPFKENAVAVWAP